MKRILALTLSLVLLLALLAGCGDKPASKPGSDKPAPTQAANPAPAPDKDDDKDKPDEPQGSTDTYTFTYASTDPEGSEHDKRVEQVLKQLLEEKSGGRMTLEVYYSGSMGSVGSVLDNVKNGSIDMGFDACGFYGDMFPYNKLFNAPCLYLGTSADAAKVLQEYDDIYGDAPLADYKIMAHVCGDTMGVFTTGGKEMRTPDDFKGMTLRTTGGNTGFVEACGGAGTGMPSGEIYESLRLNVIDGSLSTIGCVVTFNFAEVCDTFTYLPIQASENIVVMNKDLYESMNDFDKAIIDEVCVEWEKAFVEYNLWAEEHALEVLANEYPDFKIVTPTDEELAAFTEIGYEALKAMADELDAAGLDGSGALAWLESKAK